MLTLARAPSPQPRTNARDRILAAAAGLADEAGPAHLALDAVAARAGVSKGGLLYHFPTKLALLQALVETHLEAFDAEIEADAAAMGDRPQGFLRAFVATSVRMHRRDTAPSSGVAAAMIQDADLAATIRTFRRKMLERVRAHARSDRQALLFFLAVDGLCAMRLFDLDIFGDAEAAEAEAAIAAMVEEWA